MLWRLSLELQEINWGNGRWSERGNKNIVYWSWEIFVSRSYWQDRVRGQTLSVVAAPMGLLECSNEPLISVFTVSISFPFEIHYKPLFQGTMTAMDIFTSIPRPFTSILRALLCGVVVRQCTCWPYPRCDPIKMRRTAPCETRTRRLEAGSLFYK